MRFAAFFALVALVLAGCSSSQLSSSTVPYFESPDDIPREYEVIGYVSPEGTSSRSGYGSSNSRVREIQRLALQMGADAVLRVTDESASTDAAMQDFYRRAGSGTTGGGANGITSVSTVQYVAIRYLPASQGS